MPPVNAPLVPPVTVTSAAVKPLTGSLKVNVKVTGPLAVPDSLSVMTSVGATAVLNACEAATGPALGLPAASVATPAATDTPMLPAVSAGGVTTSV